MEVHDDDALIIYTDGSCLSKPRRGGYAYRLVATDPEGREFIVEYGFPGFAGATNNQMELMACIEALKHVGGRRPPVPRGYRKIVIYTDSMYIVDGIYLAQVVWPANGWRTRDDEPVLNPDLWTELVREKQRCGRVEVRRVEAHKSNVHNRAVDKLAKHNARLVGPHGPLPKRSMPASPIVRRRTSPARTERGSVPMRGQVETIRVITARPIRGHRHHVYKYEVAGDESDTFGAVDDAFAGNAIALRPGHTYRVLFAVTGQGRWIREALGEVGPSIRGVLE